MIDVVMFEKKHLDQIRAKQIYSQDETLIDRLKGYSDESSVYAYTFIHNDVPVCVLMVNVLFDRICDVVAVTSDDLHNCKFSFVKWCKSMLEVFTQKGIKRFQMVVRKDYADGCRFAEFMGFKKEGVMERYGADDLTYTLYARVL